MDAFLTSALFLFIVLFTLIIFRIVFTQVLNTLKPFPREDTTAGWAAGQLDRASKQPVGEEADLSLQLALLLLRGRLLRLRGALPVHRPHVSHLPAWLVRPTQGVGESVRDEGLSELSSGLAAVSEEAGGDISGKAVDAANKKEAENCQELEKRHAGIGDLSERVMMGGRRVGVI